MSTGLVDEVDARVRAGRRARRLYVVWQHPETRRFHRVGHLDAGRDGQYVFEYESDAGGIPGFDGFAAFPDLGHRYRSDRLFPFFTNRALSPRRPEYADYLDALDLDGDEQTPVEILARSGGTRATDTVHIVPEPHVDPHGRHILLFLASGIRHVPSASDAISRLATGDELEVVAECDNPMNPNALLLDTLTGERVGWIPDYLLDAVHDYRERGPVRVLVERANGPDAPAHVRLLCRMEAQPEVT